MLCTDRCVPPSPHPSLFLSPGATTPNASSIPCKRVRAGFGFPEIDQLIPAQPLSLGREEGGGARQKKEKAGRNLGPRSGRPTLSWSAWPPRPSRCPRRRRGRACPSPRPQDRPRSKPASSPLPGVEVLPIHLHDQGLPSHHEPDGSRLPGLEDASRHRVSVRAPHIPETTPRAAGPVPTDEFVHDVYCHPWATLYFSRSSRLNRTAAFGRHTPNFRSLSK